MEYRVKDICVYYEEYGAGTPLLMIHGWSPDHRLMKGCMEPVFSGMDRQYRRIYFDLPGMGKTPGKAWIDGSDRMLEVVLGFIDGVLPNERFLLAGESYGGYLARGIIHERASMVDGLLLICPLVREETRLKNAPPHVVLEKDEEFLGGLSDEDRQAFTGINVIQTGRVWNRFSDEILPGLKIADNAFLSENLGRNVPFSFDADVLEKPFEKPTLMLAGRQDSAVGYKDLWQILEAYPRASFVILDKCGHNLQIEQDRLFNELVLEWLDRCGPGNNR